MPLPLVLALRELRHDWISALCFVAALVGVLAPMLILLALKTGALDSMVERLVDDPANRELLAVGAGAHDEAFFRWLEARPEVGFVVPATRSINALADAVVAASPRRVVVREVPLVVSAAGDPLLAGEVGPGRVWLSAPLAKSLGVAPGGELTMVIGRRIDGLEQTARRRLEVAGVVPAGRYGRPALFLSLPDMLAIERFRDDPAVTPESWLEAAAPPAAFASFRLYARTLADLGALSAVLEGRGVAVRPRAENAAVLLQVRRGADRLYLAVAALAAVGFWAAMAANLRGMVERRRLAFSLLRMLGLTPAQRATVPLIQSLVLIGAGLGLSLALVLPAVALINASFPAVAEGAALARLRPDQLGGAAVLACVTALTAALWAMVAVLRIPSEEVLRHG
ncbi:ABC transporter [Cereibacter azotoformans]|uniref:Putative ABC transport system permease protein n=1 Tax=Cereibacter azotoformans TaxID=43057 RepID=A0A2T5JSA7_9RHOB|nr:ABC transporter [Cereibacter azotoformans]PTR11112.1 putative ABC transport system permease protein [Cereibacter azotoformans]UIJ32333.1 ABC transporter [Cereibacter azotoformans]